MTKPRVEFWAVFMYGGNLTICEKHKTANAAVRGARACEKWGGAKHQIIRAEFLERKDKAVKVTVRG